MTTVEAALRAEIKRQSPDEAINIKVLGKLVAYYEHRGYTGDDVSFAAKSVGPGVFDVSPIWADYVAMKWVLSH
jgi:hypothetical protein